MGLLDMFGSDWEDPRTQAILSMGQGLLSQRGMGGLLSGAQGYVGAMAAAKERQRLLQAEALKQELLRAQIEETRAQKEQRLASVEEARRAGASKAEMQGLLKTVLGGQGAPNQYGAEGQGLSLGGMREQMVPQPGGLAGAKLEQLAALKSLGGPDLLEFYKTARSGVKQEAGNYYDGKYLPQVDKGFTVNNGRASLIPGYAEGQASLTGATKGAEEAAKAPFTTVPFTGPGGVPQLTTLDRIRADLAQRDAQSTGRYAGAPSTPDGQRAAFDDVTRAEEEIRKWAQNSFGKRGGPAGIQTGQSPREKIADDTLTLGNQSFIKASYEPTLASGDNANKTIVAVQTARNALRNMGTSGWGTPTVVQAAGFLGALGVPQAQQFAGNAQVFQSAAMDRLWTTLNEAKGPQTEGDADRASKTFARIQNTPKANMFILDLAQAKAERDRLKAQYFRQALPLAQKNGDLQEIERRWNEKAPSVWSLQMMQKWAQDE